MAQSPSSSPRLPSPPPMAEDQVGPTSPGVNGLEDLDKISQSVALDQAASRRIRPGTKSEDMHEGPPLVNLQDVSIHQDPVLLSVAQCSKCLTEHLHTDRLCLPIDRAPQVPFRPPDHRARRFPDPNYPHHRAPTFHSTPRHRPRHLALRTLPPPRRPRQRDPRLSLRRHPLMLSSHLPRNARQ